MYGCVHEIKEIKLAIYMQREIFLSAKSTTSFTISAKHHGTLDVPGAQQMIHKESPSTFSGQILRH